MDSNQHMEVQRVSRGVYPPSFCDWRLALGIMALTQVSVLLIGIGRFQGFSWQWLSITSAFGQCLALSCASVVCAARAWFKRLSIRDAWIACWVVAVLTSIAVSYAFGVIGSVLGYGPGRASLAEFMLKSTLGVGLVGMALLRYLYMRSQWQAELTAQADARVQALQARIRPHFLFNSLNTIASLTRSDPELAERAIEDLSDLFRASLDTAHDESTLGDELTVARRYLNIESLRLGDRLSVAWDLDELSLETRVPPLILQPLLDNAIYHGIEPLPQGGIIHVAGNNRDGNLEIVISNPVAGASRRTSGTRIAQENIRQRLQIAFGAQADLLTSQAEGVYTVTLKMPGAGRK